ncbi:hypothetical protein D3C76_966680 [compost metagenome]
MTRWLHIIAAALLIAAAVGTVYLLGFKHAEAVGQAQLDELRRQHAEQAQAVAQEQRQRLQEQTIRANETEAALGVIQDQLDHERQQHRDAIAHATQTYRPAMDAAPVPVPHCVFTAAWLREYNAALGADLPVASAGGTTTGPAQATQPTADADARLLESGVTPADILAHAIDYGRWARGNVAQLDALLNLHEH